MANILIADDDADSRELLRFTLVSMGHEVTPTRNGTEALARARMNPPDMIISDILMPEIDGFDLCLEVQRDEKLRAIPFIFYTATYVSAEDEKLAMSLGGAGFIRKADDAAEFATMLENTIRQNLGKKIPPRLVREDSLSELEEQHEKIVTKKLTKKLAELQAERTAHEESLELLKAIFDAALSAIIAINPEGKIIVWNKSATHIFGFEANEALGKDLHTLIVPEDYHEKVRRGMQHFFATGDGALVGNIVELTGMRKDKSIFPVTLSVTRFRRNNAWYAAATVLDITERKQADKALRESEERFRQIAENIHEVFWMTDPEKMQMLYVSPAYEAIWGRSCQSLYDQPKSFLDAIHTEDHDWVIAALSKQPSGGYDEQYRVVRPDGSIRWIHDRAVPILNEQGKPYRVAGIAEDITERKQAESELRKLSLAVEQSPNSIVITNLDAIIEYVNDTFVNLTGYSRDDVIGKNPRILRSGKTSRATYGDMWAHLTRGEIWRGELINKRKDGSEYVESVQISPVRQADGRITHYLAIKEDITEAKKAKERIERLAHFDQLTGLPNRSLLSDRFNYALSLAQRSGEPLAVMFLDLDRFKNINDTLGHTIGDQLLMEVAMRIKASLREEDTVSRQGGDEFMLLLHDTNADGAAYVAAKLIEAISQPCHVEQHELVTTASIGIAIYPHDGKDFETLSKNADAAMYRVKQGGRNNFRFFTPEMQAHSFRTLQLANALRHALERNELQLHYQPQFSIKDGHIVGAEALLRWRHPELGMISPSEFIPIAEDSGQIIPIGEWVLRTAAKQLKDWIDSGLPTMAMAVNLSSVQFRQANITEIITHILDEVKLPPEYLELELTEAVAMVDPQAAIEVMDKLHEHGIRMSVDDFGTGYSSLSYLKKFKVYKLKIDQSFVRDITEDTEDKAIVSAIINMASSLGIQSIAEGVETAGQLNFLSSQGCGEAQGYYFSKPLPAEQFEAFVKKRQGSPHAPPLTPAPAP